MSQAHQVRLYSFLAVGLVTLVLSLTWWNTHRVCESNIHRLAQALESYKTTHGDYPMNHRQLVKAHRFFLGGIALMCLTLLLGALLSPRFIRARARNSTTACKSNLKNIGTAMEVYAEDYGGRYPRNIHLLTPGYLKRIPNCPSPGSLGYFAEFGPHAAYNSDGYQDYYLLECVGTAHENVSIPRNYPSTMGSRG